MLRFKLLHVFGTIQRYVFGYVYPTNLRSFEVALDRASDVDSMINAHGDFISTIHKSCMELKDYRSATHGFDKVIVEGLQLVMVTPGCLVAAFGARDGADVEESASHHR